MIAAEEGFDNIVEALIARGANVNEIDMESNTALLFASLNKHTSIARNLILHNANGMQD